MIRIDVSKIKNWELIKKKHSEWYEKNIFLNIKKAHDTLPKKTKSDSIEKYKELLEKIIEKGKNYVIEEELFLGYSHDYLINLIKNLNTANISKKCSPRIIFPYDKKFSINRGEWNRHKLLSLMGIQVCPYCQRNYISSFEENDDKRTTADLDHFYPKSLYPFLALSLYNFIPSCQICNSRFKVSKDAYNSVYPYEESFDDLGAKFKTSKEIIYEILGKKNSGFFVDIDYGNLKDEDNEKIQNSVSNLGLDKVYKKSHNHYIKDLLDNIEKYPKNYLESCVEIFNEYYKDENKKEKIIKYFIDIVKEPYRKRIVNGEPLAKLTKDILDEFKIKI
ncbi:hypothetical protein [Fusobacterium russii]|uniref:hypothetical protein n=1 Tax=Fusobacterium russii TaxID=854 RepID=UPI00039DD0EF|nr:hypothetical protein [Fusobacterium russii]